MQAFSKEKVTFLLFSYKDIMVQVSFLKRIARTFFTFENNNDLQNVL